MPQKLHFSLVSPERELFNGEVDQVDASGTEGDFGVFPGHAPFMTALKEGFVTVHDEGLLMRFEVQGGFADVTPQGFTILAEHAEERVIHGPSGQFHPGTPPPTVKVEGTI